MAPSEVLQLKEGAQVRYWKNGWRMAYFERPEPAKRPRVAVLLPPIMGKKRIRIPIQDVEVIES